VVRLVQQATVALEEQLLSEVLVVLEELVVPVE
jgi:hypothetical protein